MNLMKVFEKNKLRMDVSFKGTVQYEIGKSYHIRSLSLMYRDHHCNTTGNIPNIQKVMPVQKRISVRHALFLNLISVRSMMNGWHTACS